MEKGLDQIKKQEASGANPYGEGEAGVAVQMLAVGAVQAPPPLGTGGMILFFWIILFLDNSCFG